ncbi:hypothetical protein D3C74_341390 [compost metagenome]
MRNHNNRTFIVDDGFFQRDLCIDVQMARRFVKQQQVGLTSRDFSQLEHVFFSAGQRFDLLLKDLSFEAVVRQICSDLVISLESGVDEFMQDRIRILQRFALKL